MDPALSSPFARKRALFFLVPISVLAVCLYVGHGVLGFVLMCVGFWPFPFRCRVDEDGVRVSWLLVSERLSWDEIRAVELGEDRRWGVIGKRGSVLTIERWSGARVVLRGRAEVLSEIVGEMAGRRPV
jgi:hypothetical protein